MLALQDKEMEAVHATVSNLAASSNGDGRRSEPEVFLPAEGDLKRLLELRFGGGVDDLLERVLLLPIRDLTGRGGKRIRGRLVELGYELADPRPLSSLLSQRFCKMGAEIVELIHAGSLVVDDIEDGSKIRRGEPSLHQRYGLPIALNAGNWLYFWPLKLLQEMGLPKEKEVFLYRIYHRTLLRAHFGQALDVGLHIDTLEQERVAAICLSSMELKTGALTAFGLVMGAVLGGAPGELFPRLDEFGHGFGLALQMFDDIGNLKGGTDLSKRFEDLALRRPSWVWALAAKNYPGEVYRRFVAAVRSLPETNDLEGWLAQNDLIGRGMEQAREHLEMVYNRFEAGHNGGLNPRAFSRLRALGQSLEKSYG